MKPEDLRCFHAVNARQRVLAVLIAVDTCQRHVPVHFLQQTEPFPDKPGADWLAGWLSAQHLASHFADAATEWIVAEADLRQAVVRDLLSRIFQRVTGSIPAPLLLAGQRAVLNKQTLGAVVLPAVPAERVIVPLFRYQVIAVVIIPAAIPASRCRTLGIAGKDVPAMQLTKTVVLAAGSQQPLGAAGPMVKFVAAKI